MISHGELAPGDIEKPGPSSPPSQSRADARPPAAVTAGFRLVTGAAVLAMVAIVAWHQDRGWLLLGTALVAFLVVLAADDLRLCDGEDVGDARGREAASRMPPGSGRGERVEIPEPSVKEL